jgi:hypothetical protein
VFDVPDDNGDDTPVLVPAPNHFTAGLNVAAGLDMVVSLERCPSVVVRGWLTGQDDARTVLLAKPQWQLWDTVEVYSNELHQCLADLRVEERVWRSSTEPDGVVFAFDPVAPCEEMNFEYEVASGDPADVACGSPLAPGRCGLCDDDGGQGACPRIVLHPDRYVGMPVKVMALRVRGAQTGLAAFVLLLSPDPRTLSPSITGPVPSCW